MGPGPGGPGASFPIAEIKEPGRDNRLPRFLGLRGFMRAYSVLGWHLLQDVGAALDLFSRFHFLWQSMQFM